MPKFFASYPRTDMTDPREEVTYEIDKTSFFSRLKDTRTQCTYILEDIGEFGSKDVGRSETVVLQALSYQPWRTSSSWWAHPKTTGQVIIIHSESRPKFTPLGYILGSTGLLNVRTMSGPHIKCIMYDDEWNSPPTGKGANNSQIHAWSTNPSVFSTIELHQYVQPPLFSHLAV